MKNGRVPIEAFHVSVLHEADDLHDTEDDNDDWEVMPAASHTMKQGKTIDKPFRSRAASQKAEQGSRDRDNNRKYKGPKFDIWVARKDKYEKIVWALSQLNVDRASDEDKWFNVAVSLAATDLLLKIGRDPDLCDCPGICHTQEHAITKQQTRCQCPARKCSLCSRCVGTKQGQITDKMKIVLQPYRKSSASQSLLSVAEEIVRKGEGSSMILSEANSGETSLLMITASAFQMASRLLRQCSILTNASGNSIQRPCSCSLRSLGEVWMKWTARYHTFSRVTLTEEEAAKFSSGTRQMMDYDEESKSLCMTFKWHQAAKPQKGDTAKIAARRALTADQKKQNAFFTSLCRKAWHKAQAKVTAILAKKMAAVIDLPNDSIQRMEAQTLTSLGIRRMAKWIEDDQEIMMEKEREESREKTEGGIVAHNAWVRRKERLRVQLPSPQSRDVIEKPSRFDFSLNKHVLRSKSKHTIASSTVELMQRSGFRYIHAMNEGFQGRGGDLERCKEVLLKKGHILKANFTNTASENDEDNPYSQDRYYFEKQNNFVVRKQREITQRREDQRKQQYAAWIAHKAMKEKALNYLSHIPQPLSSSEESRERITRCHSVGDDSKESKDDDGYENDYEDSETKKVGLDFEEFQNASGFVKWIQVGKALKAVDRGLFDAWVQWSASYTSLSKCRMYWQSFDPIACDIHCTSSAIRDIFLKLLHRQNVNYRAAFLRHCEKKHKILLAQDSDIVAQDMTDQEKMDTFETLSLKEFSRLLVHDLGIVLHQEELQRLAEYFDVNGDQMVSMKEFLDVIGDERSVQCHGDTDMLLERVCMWETVCHECGMLTAYKIVQSLPTSTPQKHRMRAEAPVHLSRRKGFRPRFQCSVECDLRQVREVAPKKCTFASWNDQHSIPFLNRLKEWSSDTREKHLLKQIITNGSPPDAPTLTRTDNDLIDPTTTLFLQWESPAVSGINGTAFYILESMGAEGSLSYRQHEFHEIYRDPRDCNDNDGRPRYQYIVKDLQPNTKYGFRIRALNGFGAGPYTFRCYVTAPMTPCAPVAVRVSSNSIHLCWGTTDSFKQRLEELRRVFDEIDADRSGEISRDELMDQVEKRRPRLLEFLQRTQVAGDHHRLCVFDAIECDDNELISWDEFRQYFSSTFDDVVGNDWEQESVNSGLTSKAQRRNGKIASSEPSQTRYILKQCQNEANGDYIVVYRGAKTTFTVHGLASASTYQFRLQAVNEEGILSLHSEGVIVNTLLQTPKPPILLEAPTCSTIKLGWTTMDATPANNLEVQSRQQQALALQKTDSVSRILSEWAQEDPLASGTVDFRAKFNRYDSDGSSYIELSEFKTLLEELGVPPLEERLRAYFCEFDSNGDGRISLDEFICWWTRPQVEYILKRDEGFSIKDAAESDTVMNIIAYSGKDTCVRTSALEPNTMYTFRLRAFSSRARSELSEGISICTAPEAPTCAGVVSRSSLDVWIRWYPGHNGAAKYSVECELIETFSDVSLSIRKRQLLTTKGWVSVYEGAEPIAYISNLLPQTVYRLRVSAINTDGVKSEPSIVSQFCTLSVEEQRTEYTLRPDNAGKHFLVECGKDGDVVVGDTILFCERIFQDEYGNISEGKANKGILDEDVVGIALKASFCSQKRKETCKFFIGERTVAARVASMRAGKRGSLFALEVIWSIFQTNESSNFQDTKFAEARKRQQSCRSTVRKSASFTRRIRSDKEVFLVLPRSSKIFRYERDLYHFESFRCKWDDEEARNNQTWTK
ncbi:unnamed protein product [Albugo candida]|nr:unnamed protein product [Albugo candida]|eukprot:CCI44368.1 unnamed protein product [Albugo candida]